VLTDNGVIDKQIFKVSGFADTAPMPGYEPDDEVNRRVTVLLKLKESVQALSDQPDQPNQPADAAAATNDTPKN
jgi:hypothetical protein